MTLALASRRTALTPPWVRDDLWRRARAVPSLDLRFADNKSLTDAVTGASLITFTRASSGTFVDSAGVLQTAATNAPRFDHNPTTGESLGLLVEEQRSNLMLNSGTLSTQSVTVTAVAHTLSFIGTGTITLTGTSTAGPLVGTGTGESNRVSLTFTPTAGSLTLTVSGTVTNAQLEVGSFRTSYISTTGAAVTRSADVASITGSAFSGWYRQDEGTMFVEAQLARQNATAGAAMFGIETNASNAEAIYMHYRGSGATAATVFAGSAGQADFFPYSSAVPANTVIRQAIGVRANDMNAAGGGAIGATDTSCTMPTPDRMLIGFSTTGAKYLSGTIRRLVYWGQRLPNNVLQAITQ